jgi:hypothetical protein
MIAESALVIAFFTAIAVAKTYPLILQAHYALPAGLGDPAFGPFLLAWDADRIAHGFSGFWNAPYLFPHQNTLAYAEHLLGLAIFTAPIQWLTRNPVLVYNVAFLVVRADRRRNVFIDAFALGSQRRRDSRRARVHVEPVSSRPDHAHSSTDGGVDADRALGAAPVFRDGIAACACGLYRCLCVAGALERLLPLLLLDRACRRHWRRTRAPTPVTRAHRWDLAYAGLGIGAVLAPFAWKYIGVQRQNVFDRERR